MFIEFRFTKQLMAELRGFIYNCGTQLAKKGHRYICINI